MGAQLDEEGNHVRCAAAREQERTGCLGCDVVVKSIRD